MPRRVELCDEYEHIDHSIEYVIENILQTTSTRSISFESLREQFNEVIENVCHCSTTSKCVESECIHGANYVLCQSDDNIELVLNSNRRSKDVLFECTEHCSCSENCDNRLVQFGPRNHLQVEEIGVKKLGLVTTEVIPAGGFICEYAGEVLTKSEAIRRSELNDIQNNMNYIICMNENSITSTTDRLQTYIDPSKRGNIGRYLNHSCDPNCEILSVRVDSSIPKLGKLFACTKADKVTVIYMIFLITFQRFSLNAKSTRTRNSALTMVKAEKCQKGKIENFVYVNRKIVVDFYQTSTFRSILHSLTLASLPSIDCCPNVL